MGSSIISLFLPAIISSVATGGITYIFTIRAFRKKANAEAESAELNNVEKAIKIWREMAQQLQAELIEQRGKYDQVVLQVSELKASMDRLNASNTRILNMLNKMKPDNFTKIIDDIKKELEHARN